MPSLTGGCNSDFTHTVNTVKIKSNVFADDKTLNDKKNDYSKSTAYTNEATQSNYDRLAAYKACEGFLLTFRQTKKTWTGTGDNVKETYNINGSPLNGKRINKYTNENNLYDQHMSFAEFTDADKTPTADCTTDGTAYEATPVGNEYNVIVPAEGEVDMLYLPDGKYEITCHEDIDFHSFSFMDAENGNKTTKVTEEDGRWFITFSSTSNETTTSNPDRTNSTNIAHKAEIDYWRGHNDDAANIAFDGNNQIDQAYNSNVLKSNANDADSVYGIDTLNPNPTSSIHRPTVSIGSTDNENYNKFNNVTQANPGAQGNGFQINTWRENKEEDKTDAPLQYNNYELPKPKTDYGKTDEKAFDTVHNYDTFYIGSHSWAEIRENIMRNAKYNEDLITEKGQEPYGINSDANKSLYDGTSATVNSKPNVTGPKDKNWSQPISYTDKRSKYTGIVKNWKSSIAQSSTNGSYTKPATK